MRRQLQRFPEASTGSMERLAKSCIEFVPNHLICDLQSYLSHQLQTKTPAELKGILDKLAEKTW